MDQAVELGTLEREIYVDATPETVFDVVSDPKHVREWWPDEASYDVTTERTPSGVTHVTFDR